MDREKVIKGIECHRKKVQTTNAVSCLECPYAEPKPIREWCMSGLMDDIYAMLKEQEAKQTPKDIKSYYGLAGGPHGACPSCCTTIPRIIGQETRFCPFCGQAVKWE